MQPRDDEGAWLYLGMTAARRMGSSLERLTRWPLALTSKGVRSISRSAAWQVIALRRCIRLQGRTFLGSLCH